MARRNRRRQWGAGSVYQTATGWGIRWREGGRRRRRAGFATKDDAERVLAKINGNVALGEAGMPLDARHVAPLSDHAEKWLERRKTTTPRSWSNDRGHWRNHLAPSFGKLRPADVDVASIRAFVERQLRDGMNKDTIRLSVACLSTMFTDLVERPSETGVERNPCIRLPKSLRRLYRSDHDPRFTPYVESLADVVRLFHAMPEPQRVAYAIGVVAGMRPGEILGLRWEDVHLGERIDARQQAQDGRAGPLKSGKPRVLQGAFLEPLWPVLRAWREHSRGAGLILPPELTKRGTRMGAFMHPKRLREGLEIAVADCNLPAVLTWQKPWYQATRHTFATHWLRAGHSLGELAIALGHSSTFVTERYAHIRPGPQQQDPWTLDLVEAGEIGPRMGHGDDSAAKQNGDIRVWLQ